PRSRAAACLRRGHRSMRGSWRADRVAVGVRGAPSGAKSPVCDPVGSSVVDDVSGLAAQRWVAAEPLDLVASLVELNLGPSDYFVQPVEQSVEVGGVVEAPVTQAGQGEVLSGIGEVFAASLCASLACCAAPRAGR